MSIEPNVTSDFDSLCNQIVGTLLEKGDECRVVQIVKGSQKGLDKIDCKMIDRVGYGLNKHILSRVWMVDFFWPESHSERVKVKLEPIEGR